MTRFNNVIAIMNPAARSGSTSLLSADVQRVLEKSFPKVSLTITTEKGHARRPAANLGPETDLVLAIGGDGTVHEIGSGLVLAESRVPMGVVPLGSGNDFARALKMPMHWKRAVEEIAGGQVLLADTGKATWQEDSKSHECIFINALGTGFDAYTASIAPRYKSWPFSMGYTVSILSALKTWVSAGATIWDETILNEKSPRELLFSGRLMFVTVGNAPYSGGGYTINPGAKISDGFLDPCIVSNLSFWKAIQLLPKARKGRHVGMDEVTYVRTRSIYIETDRGLPVHADGEVVSMQARSIRVSVNVQSLNVVIPSSASREI